MRCKKDIPASRTKGVAVHCTWTPKARNTTIRAYPISEDTGLPLDGFKAKKATAKFEADIPLKIQHLTVAVEKAVQRQRTREKEKATIAEDLPPTSLVRSTFEMLAASPIPVLFDCTPRYEARKITYFRNHALPMLEAVGAAWTPEDTEALKTTLIDGILGKKRSKGHHATAEVSVMKELGACDKIYQRMRDIEPSLPEICLSPKHTGRHSRIEQLKSLPRKARRKVARELEKLINRDPRLAAAAILMYACGLRTAEAAAVLPEQIIQSDIVCCVYVCYQVHDTSRTKLLKSSNAYRYVPIPEWATVMLNRCFGMIYGPFLTTKPLCSPRELSATLRSILEVALADASDYLSAAEDAMRQKPDYDGLGNIMYDPVAYCLRRDWASRARHICGLTSAEIDYLLGHAIKLPVRMRKDLRQMSQQAELAKKLERYVISTKHSRHPGCAPIPVQHGSEVDLIAYDTIRIANPGSEPLHVHLDIEAVLNADIISITAPTESYISHRKRYIRTHCTSSGTPIIGCSGIEETDDIEED